MSATILYWNHWLSLRQKKLWTGLAKMNMKRALRLAIQIGRIPITFLIYIDLLHHIIIVHEYSILRLFLFVLLHAKKTQNNKITSNIIPALKSLPRIPRTALFRIPNKTRFRHKNTHIWKPTNSDFTAINNLLNFSHVRHRLKAMFSLSNASSWESTHHQ